MPLQQPTIHTNVFAAFRSGYKARFTVGWEMHTPDFRDPITDINGCVHLISSEHLEHVYLQKVAVEPQEPLDIPK
jgi:hypothetical protein